MKKLIHREETKVRELPSKRLIQEQPLSIAQGKISRRRNKKKQYIISLGTTGEKQYRRKRDKLGTIIWGK